MPGASSRSSTLVQGPKNLVHPLLLFQVPLKGVGLEVKQFRLEPPIWDAGTVLLTHKCIILKVDRARCLLLSHQISEQLEAG